MKKILKIIIFIAIVLFIYNRYFLYVDFKEGCHIKIKHSLLELSSGNIKEAIKILKAAENDEYKKLCSNIKVINPNIACGGFGGGCYYSGKKSKDEIYISTSHNDNLAWTAAVIAHETCHAIQDKENRPFDEKECYEIDNRVLKSLVVY